MTVTEAEAPVTTHPRIRQRRAQVDMLRRRRRHRWLLAGAALAAVTALGWLATRSPLLDVDEVRVVGTIRTDPDYVRRVAAVQPGTPLVDLDHRSIERRLERVPDIADVRSSHGWGGTVTIDVVERRPVAALVQNDTTIVVAADGVVLSISPGERADLPAISGVMFTAEPGARVPSALSEPLMVAAALPADVRTVTERIEVTVDSMRLRLTGGASASLGDARELTEKFDALRAFLAQVDLACIDTINVEAPRVPVVTRSC